MVTFDTNTPVDEEYVNEDNAAFAMAIPSLFTSPPAVRDPLVTTTSLAQDNTVNECLPFLRGEAGEHALRTLNASGVPRLDRQRHARFLRKSLGALPVGFVGADASRPWILYWCVVALALMGEDVSEYRAPLAATAASMQNLDTTGGFGAGHGQFSHLAATYPVVLALVIVGGREAYDVIDRRAMWKWLCALKQPNGGFQVTLGGEEGVRGCYIAMLLVTLLNLPIDLTQDSPGRISEDSTLLSGVAEYVQACQNFEGGISERPGGEAHGAYTFCGLACLAILDAPYRIFPKYLDVARLVDWLSSRQYAPEGGFNGRTNKLVDGCYSHWVGGCWPLVEACLQGAPDLDPTQAEAEAETTSTTTKEPPPLPPNDESIQSREGLIRYILCCCQDQTKRGGLRDKPSRPSDAYHSAYVLAGLSAVQHTWSAPSSVDNSWQVVFPYLDEVQIYDDADRVRTVHPVYVVPPRKLDEAVDYFRAKTSF